MGELTQSIGGFSLSMRAESCTLAIFFFLLTLTIQPRRLFMTEFLLKYLDLDRQRNILIYGNITTKLTNNDCNFEQHFIYNLFNNNNKSRCDKKLLYIYKAFLFTILFRMPSPMSANRIAMLLVIFLSLFCFTACIVNCFVLTLDGGRGGEGVSVGINSYICRAHTQRRSKHPIKINNEADRAFEQTLLGYFYLFPQICTCVCMFYLIEAREKKKQLLWKKISIVLNPFVK